MYSKPERMQPRNYPDEALLARLAKVKLADAQIPEHEFLQFRRLQALVYTLRLAGFDLEAMQTEALVGATQACQVRGRVMVTRCEFDMEITDEIVAQVMPRLYPDAVWLTSNASASHPRVGGLPLGLSDYCGYRLIHPIIGDSGKFDQLLRENPRREKNLVLMNFNDQTYPVLRGAVRRIYSPLSFVTSGNYGADEAGYAAYVADLRSHAFALAPRGAGVDTHRIWESLYAGTIPISQKESALRWFQDLPILFLDRWDEGVDIGRLEQVRDEFHRREWDLRKLTVSYWYSLILKLLNTPASQYT